MKYILILFCFISLGMANMKHEFYVSITDVYVKNDSVQIAIKIFTHDLEETLKEATGTAIFLDNSTDQQVAFKAIKSYCEPRLEVANASKNYRLEWIGHEYEDDVTWVYAYTIKDSEASILSIKNTLLQHGDHPQHNMVHLHYDDNIETKICTAQKPEVRFSLP